MSISVVCSQGHKITANEKFAGKTVKCPKCGVGVEIPLPEEPDLDAVLTLLDAPSAPQALASDFDLPSGDAAWELTNHSPVDLAADPLAGDVGSSSVADVDLGSLDFPDLLAVPSLESPAPSALTPAKQTTPGKGTSPSPAKGVAPAKAPALGKVTSPAATADLQRSTATPMVILIMAGGGGVLVGSLFVALLGWMLLGGERKVAVASSSVATLPSRASVPPDKAPPTSAPPANSTPGSAAPAAAVAGTPPPAVTSPAAAVAPKSPLDLASLPVDSRIAAFRFAGPIWAAAYDERTGRLAVTHDDQGIVIYDVVGLLRGTAIGPVGILATDGVPTAVCCKRLGDGQRFVVAGKGSPRVTVYDAATLEKVGELMVPKATFIDFLGGSPNPDDPFVYYSTQRSDATTDHNLDSNAIGRIDLVKMQHAGRAGQVSIPGSHATRAEGYDIALSADGEVIYYRPDNDHTGISTWSKTPVSDGTTPLQMLYPGMERNSGITPDPFGQSLALGQQIVSRNGWRYVTFASFEPKAYFRKLPIAFGFAEGDLVFGSSNTYAGLLKVPLPDDWFPKDAARTNDLRFRPRQSESVATPFLAAFADDERGWAVVVFSQQLVIAALDKLQLPKEPSLIVTNRLPSTIYVGREYQVELDADAKKAKFEVVLRDTDPQGVATGWIKPLGAAPKAPAGPSIGLAASVNKQQNVLLLQSVELIAPLPLPVTVQVDDEPMKVIAVDTFRNAVTVERTQGVAHSVSAPVTLITGDAPAVSSMPVIAERTFRWTPSSDQIGFQTIHLSAKSGKLKRDWYWDVTVANPTLDLPYYVTGASTPQDNLCVVWGQSVQTPSNPQEISKTPIKYYVTVVNLAESKVVRQRELPVPLVSATWDATGIYACLNKMPKEDPRTAVPSQIIRMRPDNLEIEQQTTVPDHCGGLQVIAGKYLVAYSGWTGPMRFTVPDLKLPPQAIATTRELATAGRAANGWIWDGILWDESLKTPQLLVFPYLFGVAPNSHSSRFSMGQFGMMNVNLLGPYTSHLESETGGSARGMVSPALRSALSQIGFPNDRIPADLHSLTKQLVIVAGGKLSVLDDPKLFQQPERLRFEERQTAFVVEPGKPTTVRYSASGASQYHLVLLPTPPDAFYGDEFQTPWISMDSSDGQFSISIPLTEEVASKSLNGIFNQGGGNVTLAIAKAHAERLTPAFEMLTGRKPQGLPFPIYAFAIAETEGGLQKAALFHTYLVDMPWSALEKVVSN